MKPLNCDVVMAVSRADADLAKSIEERLGIFERDNVSDLVHPAIIETNEELGMEAVIIDEKSAQLSFPNARGSTDLHFGIFFRDQPDLCRYLAAWFDNKIKAATVDFRKWRERNWPSGKTGEIEHVLGDF